jgi:hypothetical protein
LKEADLAGSEYHLGEIIRQVATLAIMNDSLRHLEHTITLLKHVFAQILDVGLSDDIVRLVLNTLAQLRMEVDLYLKG